jgi:hypothetical protein
MLSGFESIPVPESGAPIYIPEDRKLSNAQPIISHDCFAPSPSPTMQSLDFESCELHAEPHEAVEQNMQQQAQTHVVQERW